MNYEYRVYKERRKKKLFGGEQWIVHETSLGIMAEEAAKIRFNQLKQFAEELFPGLFRNFKLLRVEVIA